MASGHSSRDSPSLEDDELKGDGKKRKFKPFQAVRNFFSKNKRKTKDEQVSVVAVKAKSTTALHNDNEDDDGGFQSPPRPLGGNRSISEDSVFSPEQRETNLQALKKTAVSEESIPKSAFQAELFSKLNKRRSQHSDDDDDDDDDGLPHSPTPPVTTADIIMGGPLKPLPAGKSTSRESDKSLISMDGSENEEEDLFRSKWKSSVPSKLSKTEQSGGSEGPIEFDKVSNTELLKSDAARDRINIKPRARKATRKSQIKRDGSSSHSLPSLNEESPTKSQTGEEKASSPKTVVTPQDSVDLEVGIPADQTEQSQVTLRDNNGTEASQLQMPARPDSASSSQKSKPAPVPTGSARPHSAGEEEVKRSSLKSTVTVSTEGGGASAKRASFAETGGDVSKAKFKETSVTPTSDYDNVIVSAAVNAALEVAKKGSVKDSPHISILSSSSPAKKGQNGSDIAPSSKPQVASSSSSQNIATAVESSSIKVQAADSLKPPGSEVSSSGSSEKEGESSAPASVIVTTTASPASGTEGKKEGLRPTDEQTAAYSPKDDYRLKRQSRSKTLPEQPVSKDENFATKVQRTASHRVEPSSSQNVSPEASPRLRFAGTEKGKSVESTPTKEPEWFALARRKTGRKEEKKESPAASPTKETAPGKEALSISVTELAVAKADTVSAVKSDTVTAVKSDTVSAVKSDSVAPVSQPSDAATVSPATSKSEKPAETTPSDVTRMPVRGGSVKTSPTKLNTTSAFANRGSSVKVLSTRSDIGSSRKETSTVTQLTTVVTQSNTASSSAAAAAKQETIKEEPKNTEAMKEEPKCSDSSPAKEVPKWKTQSTKVTKAATPTATPMPARFGSAKSGSTTTTTASSTTSTAAAPVTASSAAKVESKPTTTSTAKVESKPTTTSTAKVESKPSSPVKTPAVSKASSVDSTAKDEKAVPAWRANLGGKKTGGLGADIRIELIESSSSSSAPASSAASDKKEDASKKQDSPSKAAAGNKDMQTDQCRGSASSRSSKVLDLVKNFQNLQVS